MRVAGVIAPPPHGLFCISVTTELLTEREEDEEAVRRHTRRGRFNIQKRWSTRRRRCAGGGGKQTDRLPLKWR